MFCQNAHNSLTFPVSTSCAMQLYSISLFESGLVLMFFQFQVQIFRGLYISAHSLVPLLLPCEQTWDSLLETQTPHGAGFSVPHEAILDQLTAS
jgi:hypothetical protein